MSNFEGNAEATPVINDVNANFWKDPESTNSPVEDDRSNTQNSTGKSVGGWKAILEYGMAQDEKLLSEWKDELANLLTFTGLFSAVVTGFIVLTLPMLQEDPATKSTVILAQISQQLSSFSIGPHFVNSTVPASIDSQAADSPDPLVVRLNILWVLSLTLSVMAAFFTITVQQWLRRIPLPPHLSVRDAVRLWRMRQFGLHAWKVPAIISLLPVLVQVSVVLFLVGLYFLLETLHRITALVLLVFGSSLLGIFLISAVLPLLFKPCPYKSPVIPAIITIAQLCAMPVFGVLWLLFSVAGNFTIVVLQLAILEVIRVVGLIFSLGSRLVEFLWRHAANPETTARSTVKHVFPKHKHLRLSLGAFSFKLTEWVTHSAYGVMFYIAAPSTLWDRLELRYAVSLWHEQRNALQSCLADIPPDWRPLVGTNSLQRALLARHRDVSMIHPLPRSPVFFYASQHLPRLVSELEDVIWQSLPIKWSDNNAQEQKSYYGPRAASLICLLYKNKVLGLNPERPPTASSISIVAKALIAIRAQQHAVDILKTPRERHPSSLLFGCCFRGYILSEEELLQSAVWTLDVLRSLAPRTTSAVRVLQREAYAVPLCDVVLGSLATTLMGCTSDRILHTDSLPIQAGELREMLQHCAGFLAEYAEDISIVTSIIAHVPPDKHIVVASQALASLANSITRLAAKGYLAKSADCPSYEVVRLLRQICGDAYGDELRDTERYLDAFDRCESNEELSDIEIPGPFLLSTRPKT